MTHGAHERQMLTRIYNLIHGGTITAKKAAELPHTERQQLILYTNYSALYKL